MAHGKIAGVWNSLISNHPKLYGHYWLRGNAPPYSVLLAHYSPIGWQVFVSDGSVLVLADGGQGIAHQITVNYGGWLPVKTPHGSVYG
jgi:hypothetical protein